MRLGLVILTCLVLLASGANASRAPHFVPQSISFWDPQDGIATFDACGPTNCVGRIATTSDGGRTWTARRHGPWVGEVSVARGSTDAWVETERGLLRSEDGGETWELVPHTAGLNAFSFPTRRAGYVLRGEQFALRLVKTENGGQRWSEVRLPCGRILAQAAILSFATARHGWLLCAGQPSAGWQGKALYETVDGAGHWQRLPRRTALYGGGYAHGMSITPSGAGLLWEARGSTYKTTSGGRHWRSVSITSPEEREGSTGWVVSRRTSYLVVWDTSRRDIELMRSDDSARTWRLVRRWSRD
jgi:photosystem II stability/assembly factor-like uncharacterized protein